MLSSGVLVGVKPVLGAQSSMKEGGRGGGGGYIGREVSMYLCRDRVECWWVLDMGWGEWRLGYYGMG